MKLLKNLFKRTFLWERMRDRWIFSVMIAGKSCYPTWVENFLFR